MARRKRNFRRRVKAKGIPLSLVGGVAGSILMPNSSYPQGTAAYLMKGEWHYAAGNVVENFTGYSILSNRWAAGSLIKGLTPLIVGSLVHKFVGGSPLNLNQKLARSNVPYIRI